MKKIKALSIRQILRWGSLVLILAVSISIIIYINNNIANIVELRDKVITDKYEGSLSENLGFLTMLTAEISSHLDLESDEEKKKAEKIKAYLVVLRDRLEKLRKPQTGITITPNANIEKVNEQKELMSWLYPASLSQINFKNLNLKEEHPKAHPTRPYLHSLKTNKSIPLKSFVLIPSPIVSIEDDDIQLSTTIKKEVIFSKIIENDLVDIFENLRIEDIWQVYFIPISGMVRVVKPKGKKQKNLVEYYNEILPSIVCFSDRPYFKNTMEKQGEISISPPYIDVAGNGIIITYSVFIMNKELDIVGMIGIDRKIGPLKNILNQLTLGASNIPKDFQFITHPIEEKECCYCHTGKYGDKFDYKYMRRNFENEAFPLAIAEAMERPNELFKKDRIARIEFPGRESMVYLVRISKEELACFHFNPKYTKRKYQFLLLFYVLSLVGMIVLTVLALRFFVGKFRVTKIHTEVVSNLNGGLVILDGKGNIKYSNRKMEELLEDLNLPNRNFLVSFLDYESRAEYKGLIQKSREGFEFAGRITRSDGTVFPAIITSASVNYPGVANAHLLIVIPTEQLESTIAANFILGFSHALKTPIQSILLLSDRLRRKKLPQQKFDRYFSLMKQQVGEFTTMVTNLLRFSKWEIEEIRAVKKNHNLAALLRSAIKPFKEKAAKVNIDLIENIPESLVADIDSDMFRVILNNLLENALKYTEEGEISVEAYEKGDEVVISVIDAGIGVPGDEKENIFKKFFRGKDPKVRDKDGIGIGLYVSNQYVRLHSGTITYEPNIKQDINEKGKLTEIKKGSKFILRFPKELKEESTDEEN